MNFMDNYWNTFWRKHSKSTTSQDPQCHVLRTLNKKPISNTLFQRILKDIEEKLEIYHSDEVLDLCCGNGLITAHIASKCKRVIGVDFAKELIAQIDVEKHKNISVVKEDIRKVNFEEQSFNKVVIYAGLQYLSYKEAISLFESVMRWLKSDGLFYIGDIPDWKRLWNFFNTNEREKTHFDSIKNDKPIIGTWFDSEWLVKLGRYTNFNEIVVLQQPDDFPYSHYRFDIVLKK